MMSGVSKNMIKAPDATVEDYKTELKQCLRENIEHKREIKRLRQKRKDADTKMAAMQKEIDELKARNDQDTQKALRMSEKKNRLLQTRVTEMKAEQESLQKHNREFKEYFDKQQERMNALRNVNANLNKKLHQRIEKARKEPAFQELEQHWHNAEARVQDLEAALKTSSA